MDRRRLAYLKRMGVDVWVTRASAAQAQHHPEPQPEPGLSAAGARPAPDAAPTAEVAPEAVAAGAAEPEVAALDWADLADAVATCTRCRLHESRTQGVLGVGDTAADLVVVGEAPGADEDRKGEPFVGRAGQLLDQMLAAIDRSRHAGGVYITNVLKSRPPKNRDPLADEVAACEPYLRRQLELLGPKVILALGRVAAQNLLKSEAPLGRLRGRWHAYGPQETPLLVTYHPAYLLRSPAEKAKAWDDLKQVRRRLHE